MHTETHTNTNTMEVPMNRYYAAQQGDRSFYIVDTFNDYRASRDEKGPLVFGSAEDAAWYADELNYLRTPAEIVAGI